MDDKALQKKCLTFQFKIDTSNPNRQLKIMAFPGLSDHIDLFVCLIFKRRAKY
jgi:hypothetical protein